MPADLYVHFPFCRRKCSYCALYSRAGVAEDERDGYVRALAERFVAEGAPHRFKTVYFGGGSPALCDLDPLLDVLSADEFTVELHPLDVTVPLLQTLRAGGVNRISMGVQSLEDSVLAHMGRGYTALEAERAFALVREHFENAGIDLIVGYPDEGASFRRAASRLAGWGLRHCSVYSLVREPESRLCSAPALKTALASAPDDETVMDRVKAAADLLGELGLERYEISNYAVPGYECRHNLAVWRGEDYWGVGDGAHGRIGLERTVSQWGQVPEVETVSCDFDRKERRLFRLRTREGLESAGFPEWEDALNRFVSEGLLTREGTVCRLTSRGTEVCDTILSELV